MTDTSQKGTLMAVTSSLIQLMTDAMSPLGISGTVSKNCGSVGLGVGSAVGVMVGSSVVGLGVGLSMGDSVGESMGDAVGEVVGGEVVVCRPPLPLSPEEESLPNARRLRSKSPPLRFLPRALLAARRGKAIIRNKATRATPPLRKFFSASLAALPLGCCCCSAESSCKVGRSSMENCDESWMILQRYCGCNP